MSEKLEEALTDKDIQDWYSEEGYFYDVKPPGEFTIEKLKSKLERTIFSVKSEISVLPGAQKYLRYTSLDIRKYKIAKRISGFSLGRYEPETDITWISLAGLIIERRDEQDFSDTLKHEEAHRVWVLLYPKEFTRASALDIDEGSKIAHGATWFEIYSSFGGKPGLEIVWKIGAPRRPLYGPGSYYQPL